MNIHELEARLKRISVVSIYSIEEIISTTERLAELSTSSGMRLSELLDMITKIKPQSGMSTEAVERLNNSWKNNIKGKTDYKIPLYESSDKENFMNNILNREEAIKAMINGSEVAALTSSGRPESAIRYYKNGQFIYDSGDGNTTVLSTIINYDYIIVRKKITKTMYLNVYHAKVIGYADESLAKKYAEHNRIACIPIEIEYHKGEGIKE